MKGLEIRIMESKNHRILKACLLASLYLSVCLTMTALFVYNDGRECMGYYSGCNIADAYDRYDTYPYYEYSFNFSLVNMTQGITKQLIFSMSLCAILMLPWVVWALRKRGFSMTWWRWLLLVAEMYVLLYPYLISIYKATHKCWYDFSYGGPSWWETLGDTWICVGILYDCFLKGWVFYEIVRGVVRLVKKRRGCTS